MTKPMEKWANYVWQDGEVWKPINGFFGYEVSDLGRVRTWLKGNPRPMNFETDKDGYKRVALRKDGRYAHKLVHRLVAEAFIGPAPDGKQMCCHCDNNRANNVPSNLRWDDQKGNVADKLVHGTHQIGSTHPCATIDESKAREVKRALSKTGKRERNRLVRAVQETGVSYHIVAGISSDKCWRHA